MKRNILAFTALMMLTTLMQPAFARMGIVNGQGGAAELTGELYLVAYVGRPYTNDPSITAEISTSTGQLNVVIDQNDLPFGFTLTGAVGRTVKVVTPDMNQVTSFTILPVANSATNVKK